MISLIALVAGVSLLAHFLTSTSLIRCPAQMATIVTVLVVLCYGPFGVLLDSGLGIAFVVAAWVVGYVGMKSVMPKDTERHYAFGFSAGGFRLALEVA